MRKSKGPQSALSNIKSDDSLNSILKRAQKLRILNMQLQKILPPQVKGSCQLANIRNDIAILTCTSQLEASKIRMYSRPILQAIQREFKTSIKKIQVKVVLEP